MSIILEKINKTNGQVLTEADISKIDGNATKIENAINNLPSSSVVTSSSTNGNIKIDGVESVVYTHPSGTNPHGTTKADVGLGDVTNESKATMFTSPTFTGTPLATTATMGTNTTQIATTEFVQSGLNLKANSSHTHTKSQINDLPTIPIIVALTSSEYSAISSPDPNTLYLIKV